MIKVKAVKTAETKDGGITEVVRVYLKHDGLACKQMELSEYESDYPPSGRYRISEDNGKTYGEWQEISQESTRVFYGNDEACDFNDDVRAQKVWNPVHRHYVRTYFHRYCIDGHEKAYNVFWTGKLDGTQGYYDHQYIRIYKENEENYYAQQLLKYEDGVDFDENNPRNPEFLMKNRGYLNPPVVLKNGDILVAIGAPVEVCCKRAGVDVNEVFPSTPQNFLGVIVARGVFNKETELYDFTFSRPVILSDLQSSRGIDEPALAELENGKILLVMRGSNVQEPAWNTRILKGAPAVKWFSYSTDGGKTFTPPAPWHFNDGEVVYSSATIHDFIRIKKSGKLYWVGNVTGHDAYENYPRWPLCICEVDEKDGTLKKDSLTMIDTRREGESWHVQLSNFWMVEDRETGILEISLCKLAQFESQRPYYGEGWRYEITFED